MKNEFKAGDLVFEILFCGEIKLVVLKPFNSDTYIVEGDIYTYTSEGLHDEYNERLPKIFHATPENRQALVTLYGEDAVPKLPVRGSELTKKLLEKQKYMLCYVSDTNDADCRENKRLSVIERFEDGYFYKGKVNGPFVCSWKYAVPVDMNGNEITEIE